MISLSLSEPERIPTRPVWFPLGLLLAIAMGLAVIYHDGLAFMVKYWGAEEYSHGYLIPLVAIYMAYLKRFDLLDALRSAQPAAWGLKGSRWGLGLLAVALLVFFLGELGTVYTIIQYSFLLAIWALIYVSIGSLGVRILRNPMIYLVFMIPLPNFLYNNLSASLQLLSSDLGVQMLRLMQVSVYLEGNVIDLGTYKLQVAEACSGLRYLFPLVSFSFLVASFYKRNWLVKMAVVLSALPITLLMNSLRIAVIGLTVDMWGIEMAEGVLHAFEGWVVFIGCLSLLALEIMLIERLIYGNAAVLSALDFGDRESTEGERGWQAWQAFGPIWAAVVLRPLLLASAMVTVTALLAISLNQRDEIIPERSPFSFFPLLHDGWIGREQGLTAEIQESLKVTDYINADYLNSDASLPVNLYVAYYESQRKGASVHSPRSCIPADGWVISQLEQVDLSEKLGYSFAAGQKESVANRVVIRRGEQQNLVLYWFDQRGRVFSNEYLAKWYIFWDSLMQRRSDGALVRLVTPIAENETPAEAEERLLLFIKSFDSLWNQFLPE